MSTVDQQAPAPARRVRWKWVFVILGIAALFMLLFAVGVTAWEYTNSTGFCGTTCHTMPPEYTAYLTSPHARVACVDCHLGQESTFSAVPRKAGEMRHVVNALTKKYETPVYVKALRPARFTCEKCHYPEKFSTDSVVSVKKYGDDLANSAVTNWLVMKTGGGSQRQGLGKGIHSHIENEVWYLPADDLKQEIPYVKTVGKDGAVTEYFDVQAALPADFVEKNRDKLRRMDCIDCHNRVSHQFRIPGDVIDDALSRGLIDVGIPEIKRRATELFVQPYVSQDQAAKAFEQLGEWYQAHYPDYYAKNQDKIRAAISTLQESYRSSVFPDMDVAWPTHPDNIGHKDFPGCFRCHDGKHVSNNNTTIRLECNLCHTIPEVVKAGDPRPVIPLEKTGEPESHLDSNWIARHRYSFDETCIACHDVANPGGSDNSSFCSNSACHATEWKFVGLDAPKIRELVAPPRVPSKGVPRPIPHPVGARTDCTICHGPGKVHPNPANHASFTPDTCTSCHKPVLQEATSPAAPATGSGAAPATAPGTPPAIPHPLAGRDNCLMCHNPEGGLKPAPKNHVGRTIGSCQSCHKPAQSTGGAPAQPAATNPTVAPTEKAPAATPAATVAPTPTAAAQAPQPTVAPTPTTAAAQAPQSTAVPTTAAEPAGGPVAIPHDLAGRENCLMCHNPDGGMKPAPKDHAGRANDICQSCHKPAAQAGGGSAPPATPTAQASSGSAPAAGGPKAIPHDLAGRDNCLLCHNPDRGVKPAPKDHVGRTSEQCQGCHKPKS